MAQKISPCPDCGCKQIEITPSCGGKGTGDLTAYRGRCGECRLEVNHLSRDGSKRSAIADWNRYAAASKNCDTAVATESNILDKESKGNVDSIIRAVKGEKYWPSRPELFAKLFSASGIKPDTLVFEDRNYIPVSIYMLLRINDTAVSDFFFKEYGEYIRKTFTVPGHGDTKYSYLLTFYQINERKYGKTTDHMTGAVFLLRDISFDKVVNRRNEDRTTQWLQYLLLQMDRYMEDGEEKEVFRREIEVELEKTKAIIAEMKKKSALEQLDRLMEDVGQIGDIDFLLRIKQAFDRKINERIMA